MRQLFLKNIGNKLQAESYKPQSESFKFKVECTKPSFRGLNFMSFNFALCASGFLLISFGTKMRLLWRRSVQVRFSMASSFLGSFQMFWEKLKAQSYNLKPFDRNRKAFCFSCSAFSLRLIALGLLLLAFSFSTKAQNSPEIDTTIAVTDSANVYYDDSTTIDKNVVDTTKIDNKKIMAAIFFLSEDSIKSWRQSKGFGYMAYLDSLLKAKEAAKKKQPKNKLQRQEEQSSTSFWDVGIVKLLCWIVAIGVVAFVLYKLFLGQGSAFSSNAKNNIPQVDMEEEPDLADLDGQLKKAVQAGNYRLATRYLFLKTLQQLSDRKAISLSTEKTNIQYSQELRGKPYEDSFARLCLLYEYVWFGEFDINEAQFASIQQQQQQLIKAI